MREREEINMSIRSYQDLLVWQKAMDLVVECYRITTLLPKNETYGLVNQMQRVAVSVPANIAEGHGRDHLGDYLPHSFVRGQRLTDGIRDAFVVAASIVLSEIQRIGERTKNDR